MMMMMMLEAELTGQHGPTATGSGRNGLNLEKLTSSIYLDNRNKY